jgi:hypothetical protein
MPDHPLRPPKLPTLPPPPRAPTRRVSGSSEVPPPIVLSEPPTPPLGVPKLASFESRTINTWRDHVPSLDQWMIACACILTAAAVGFAIGRSSAPSGVSTMSAAPQHSACPDPTNQPSAAGQPSGARDVGPATESHAATPPGSPESPAPVASAVLDAASQQATEKAIARAMGRASRRAASCRGTSSPAGTAHVTVTFLPSGEVKTTTVRGAPFAGTAEGECIGAKFRSLRVPPFTGDDVTVRRDLMLE